MVFLLVGSLSHTNFWGWIKRPFEGKQTSPENEIHAIRERVQHMTTSSWFNVVSSDSAIQKVFEKLRNQMHVDKFYTEVQERCNDLDESPENYVIAKSFKG